MMPEIRLTRDELLASLLASVIEFHPGDVLVLRVPKDMTEQQADALRNDLKRCFAGLDIRFMVIPAVIDVEVVRREAGN